ncbi:ArsR family transcriptional regulator [Salinadaptatus halalkaliphilus]|uniref:ArsR family transcriptional regulator n=1 Tax=Salinadaptatus halalkaliphilus TaxID=2419781 RepID=A0A4S3TQK7_9EURY|nr:helix-turn-helix domain-containing protein [Salinadaptatus halalkaliphilus]THE65573.1 ArsR family transcriptional regulator [Salinadaptatus halalkaliphilus]
MSTLTDILPSESQTPEASLRVVDVDHDEADELFDVLSSETRRNAYRCLFDEPATASELATRLDTSVQNVSHHVSMLEEATLVEPVGKRYSEKGNEMVVYGPASDPLVFVGREEIRPQVDRSLSEVVTGLGIIAAGSLFVQWGIYELLARQGTNAAGIETASRATELEGTQGLLAWLVFEAGEPGLIFFVGCLLIAGLVSLTLYR